MENEKLKLTEEWDKTFPKSDKVDHKKITFHNRYGITLAADMYIPKEGKESFWRCQRTSFWFVCPNYGRTRFLNDCV